MASHLQSGLSTKRRNINLPTATALVVLGWQVTCFRFASTYMLRTQLRHLHSVQRILNEPRRFAMMTNGDMSSVHDSEPGVFSLGNLQQRVAAYVGKQGNTKLSFVIAGGGGHILSTLAATPSASSVLLDGTIAYSREAFRDYIAQNDHSSNNGTRVSSTLSHTLNDEAFKYCSMPAAGILADAACQRSLHLSTAEAASSSPIWGALLSGSTGVACTSVLQTVGRKSHNKYGSRAYCSVQTSTGSVVQMQVKLVASNGRTRFDEDVFVSHCLMTCLELLTCTEGHGVLSMPGVVLKRDGGNREVTPSFRGTTTEGDELEVSVCTSSPPTEQWHIDQMLRTAAERILSGRDEVVTVLPTQSSFEVLHTTRLPPNSLVVPGSFNPPHAGHVTLAKMAAESIVNCSAIWFELSITNVDKPALQLDAVAERLNQLLALRHEMPNDLCWGILLTNAPLFKQKVELLAPLQIGRNSVLHFSIGTDTLVRLIDTKYYNGSEEEMMSALTGMPCCFVVGGRLDQRKTKSESVFLSGEGIIEHLPENLRGKFRVLPDFRIDLSSTEIRERIAEENALNNSHDR